MTSHELARRLLAGPDVLVVVREDGDGLWSPSCLVSRSVVKSQEGNLFFECDEGESGVAAIEVR